MRYYIPACPPASSTAAPSPNRSAPRSPAAPAASPHGAPAGAPPRPPPPPPPGAPPGLALILVGDNPSSISYVRSKGDAAEEAGIFSETFHLSDPISQEELTSRILDLDEDPRFHALLVQLP